jgi:hypothetical protein
MSALCHLRPNAAQQNSCYSLNAISMQCPAIPETAGSEIALQRAAPSDVERCAVERAAWTMSAITVSRRKVKSALCEVTHISS